MFWRVVAIADEDGGRACFIVGHGFASSSGVDDQGSSTYEVCLLLVGAVPMSCLLPGLSCWASRCFAAAQHDRMVAPAASRVCHPESQRRSVVLGREMLRCGS